MGLLDYYRQFDDVDQEEVNRELRARRARERELALAEVPTIDLSSTEWPDLPSSEVMNAAIAAARGAVNSYPDRHAETIRSDRGSEFLRCGLSDTDPSFPKYPRLPVLRCSGYERQVQ